MRLTFDLSLLALIDELLVEGDDALGDGLTDGIQLRGVTSSADAHANIEILESLETEQKNGLPDLDSKTSRLEEVDGGTVDSHDSLSLADAGDSD